MTHSAMSGPTAGFAMRDLLVGVLVAAVLAAGVWVGAGLLRQWRDRARVTSCRKNLAAIGAGVAEYRGENQGRLPALFRVGDPGMPVGPDTVWEADNRLSTTGADKTRQMRRALGSNAMQNMWLLLSGNYHAGGEAAFRCPADEAWRPRNIPPGVTGNRFGWTDARNVSYGLHFPYAAMGEPVLPEPDGWPDLPADPKTWNGADPNGLLPGKGGPTYPEDAVYMADRNPRFSWEGSFDGYANHKKGLNCLLKGGSVSTHDGLDAHAGLDHDDVYQARGPNKPTGLPYQPADRLDKDGHPAAPCTDTVIWPLMWRVTTGPGR